MKGVILFGHGARNPGYIEPFLRMRAAIELQRPGLPVEIGFLELTQPPLEAGIERLVGRGVTQIKVVPIFFAPGRHVTDDLPRLLTDALKRFPGIEFEVTDCIGAVDAIIVAIATHAVGA